MQLYWDLTGCKSQTRDVDKAFENWALPCVVIAFARNGCVVAPVPLCSLAAWTSWRVH